MVVSSSQRDTIAACVPVARRVQSASRRGQLELVGRRAGRFADLEQRGELLDELVAAREEACVLDRHGRLIGQDLEQPQVVIVEVVRTVAR